MKKGFLIYIVLIGFFSTNAQEKKKDTIVETEIVNVVTKYNPKIADAKKIKNNPTIKLIKRSAKKKLNYTIFSAPVASTFIPKTGVVKGIDVGIKERIYNNYIAAGFGNYTSPFAELFIYKNTRFDNEFGVHVKYNASEENVRNSILNSNFSNFSAATFFKQEARYFDWKVSLDSERNNYNWYGLPSNRNFSETVVNTIAEAQNYNYFKLAGDFKFHDSYIENGTIAAAYFTDKYKSSEILADFDANLDLPLDFLNKDFNEISVNTGVEFLKGTFKNSYNDATEIDYNQITLRLHPEYQMNSLGFSLKAGFKTFVSFDLENELTNFLLYPDVLVETPIIKKYINAYAGVTGNLHTNTYKQFTEENPYVSPTLFITQTAETSNLFIGFKGNLTSALSYHIKASTKKEEDKPLFFRNNSKSEGTSAVFNGEAIKGYEYGNSFGIFYDDVQTTSIFAEAEYKYDKHITFASQIQFDKYTTTNALESWNLPTLQGALLTKYKANKWYATTNIFYVSERKDALYDATFPSSLTGIQTLNSFIDLNLDSGYHFNDKFSAFLRLNNILNTDYQRFANFDTQGFQILGGITYKFDF
ncbi:TonB-dependent receptor [uncultured Polaribacter sp.]|uniref:TonB-dependent receptor n=1 Tax=uncultured Polaribacter sp. TaxID=174711 RepID=UPI002626126A|nr:TonB-dependent receptor [uncultured Polaribacter sp.]